MCRRSLYCAYVKAPTLDSPLEPITPPMPDLLGMSRQTTGAAAPPADAPPPPTKMSSTALVFLENPIARKLAVAWPLCGDDEDTWLETAGILSAEIPDARRLMTALRRNGVCRDDAVLDSLAEQYIAALVAAPITRGRKPSGGQAKR